MTANFCAEGLRHSRNADHQFFWTERPEFRIAENQNKNSGKKKTESQAYFMDGQRFFRRSPVRTKSRRGRRNAGEVMIKFAFFLVSEKSGLCLGSVASSMGMDMESDRGGEKNLARKKPRERRRKKLDEAATTKRNAELGKHAGHVKHLVSLHRFSPNVLSWQPFQVGQEIQELRDENAQTRQRITRQD